ncbi:4-phosphopantetheinyl transferase EntD [Escherichia coli]|nr:4-phosphopantetheinyl transferase EntD [Escherichia coli]
MTVGFIFIAKMHTVHARCGVNALSGLRLSSVL